MGAAADMIMTPGGAMVIGAVAGALSTAGFSYVSVSILYVQ